MAKNYWKVSCILTINRFPEKELLFLIAQKVGSIERESVWREMKNRVGILQSENKIKHMFAF